MVRSFDDSPFPIFSISDCQLLPGSLPDLGNFLAITSTPQLFFFWAEGRVEEGAGGVWKGRVGSLLQRTSWVDLSSLFPEALARGSHAQPRRHR